MASRGYSQLIASKRILMCKCNEICEMWVVCCELQATECGAAEPGCSGSGGGDGSQRGPPDRSPGERRQVPIPSALAHFSAVRRVAESSKGGRQANLRAPARPAAGPYRVGSGLREENLPLLHVLDIPTVCR